nr:HNH endonuclease [Candidatus Omnitrophota bacterium]
PSYSVILMSQRTNAPYKDKIHEDGITIEYEGHDVSKRSYTHDPKGEDQPEELPPGTMTQNGKFKKAVEEFKAKKRKPELVKVYEKILAGTWSLKGVFHLVDYKYIDDGRRKVFRFILRLSEDPMAKENLKVSDINLPDSRLIPSEVKKEVWKRDKGRCVLCGSIKNLHFDHDLPFSKGGTSLSIKNVRLLCMKHNLEKSGKIE